MPATSGAAALGAKAVVCTDLNGANAAETAVDTAVHPGELLLLYTDGLYECRNSNGEIFGKDRLYETIEKYRHLPIRKLVDKVFAEVKVFRQDAKPEDDISLLGVVYTGTN